MNPLKKIYKWFNREPVECPSCKQLVCFSNNIKECIATKDKCRQKNWDEWAEKNQCLQLQLHALKGMHFKNRHCADSQLSAYRENIGNILFHNPRYQNNGHSYDTFLAEETAHKRAEQLRPIADDAEAGSHASKWLMSQEKRLSDSEEAP